MVALVDAQQQRAADGGVVEGRMQVVDAGAGVGALRQALADDDILVALQQRDEVVQRVFPIVLLVVRYRSRGGGAVGDDGPLDAVQLRDAGAGDAVRRAGAGAVGVGPGPGGAAAGVPLVLQEAERAGAGGIDDLLEGVGAGEALGEDEAGRGAGLGQGGGQQGEGLGQAEAEAAVVERVECQGQAGEGLTQAVAGHPAADAGDAVIAADGFVVVEAEAFAEGEGPFQAVGVLDAALGHGGAGDEVGIHGE